MIRHLFRPLSGGMNVKVWKGLCGKSSKIFIRRPFNSMSCSNLRIDEEETTIHNEQLSHTKIIGYNIHTTPFNLSLNNDLPTPPIPPPLNNDNNNNNNSTNKNVNINFTLGKNENSSSSLLDPDNIDRPSIKPSELVKELDKFIIGQSEAKRAVAVALRNRWRRHQLPAGLKEDVSPKNILMIGPTGCGKTEIARRLAKVTHSPFIKVEATKFTEVGFHGRDVDSIIQDLLRSSINMMKQRRRAKLKEQVTAAVNEKLLDALLGRIPGENRETYRNFLISGALDNQSIDIEILVKDPDLPDRSNSSNSATLNEMLTITRALRGKKTEVRKLKISEARPILEEMEIDHSLSNEDIVKSAIKAVEQDGIVFLDEIDKIISSHERKSHSADASAEGVQRDLLPLIEGTTVTTKQGDVKTDHILFIASGAFHSVKPSDMMAELQGRLPIRVSLTALTEEDFIHILTQTKNNLIEQQIQLMAVDGVQLSFTSEAIRLIAKVSFEINRSVENIGARRLHTVIEKIMDEISYSAPDKPKGTQIIVDEQFVNERVKEMMTITDLKKFLL